MVYINVGSRYVKVISKMADNDDKQMAFRVEGTSGVCGWEVAKHKYPLRIDKPMVITMNGKRRITVKIKK